MARIFRGAIQVWHGSVRWGWFAVLLAMVFGMTSSGEYLGALVVAWLSLFSMCSKVWHWAERKQGLWRGVGVIAVLFLLISLPFSYFVINEMRGDATWSHIPKAWDAMMVASEVRIPQISQRTWNSPSVPTIPYAAEPLIVHDNEGTKTARIAAPPLVITKVVTTMGHVPGDKIKVELDLKVNNSGPQTIHEITAQALKQIPEDQDKRAEFEQAMWDQVLAVTNSSKMDIPSSNESVALPVTSDAFTAESAELMKSSKYGWYFMVRVADTRNRTLLDFCGYVVSDGSLIYCRYHNSP